VNIIALIRQLQAQLERHGCIEPSCSDTGECNDDCPYQAAVHAAEDWLAEAETMVETLKRRAGR
jgi:hypothetical protein